MIKIRRHNYVADPTLAELANQLKLIQFDIEPEEREDFFQASLDGRLRNISVFQDRKTYRIRMYIGGKQRFLGATTNGPAAARFADMARIFFWPYRQRDCREPVLTDMNNSVEQAKQDLAENEPAVRLLDAIKAHLLAIGAINETELDQPRKESRRSVAEETAQFLRELAAERKDILAEQAKFFDEIRKAFHHILERLTALEENTKKKES